MISPPSGEEGAFPWGRPRDGAAPPATATIGRGGGSAGAGAAADSVGAFQAAAAVTAASSSVQRSRVRLLGEEEEAAAELLRRSVSPTPAAFSDPTRVRELREQWASHTQRLKSMVDLVESASPQRPAVKKVPVAASAAATATATATSQQRQPQELQPQASPSPPQAVSPDTPVFDSPVQPASRRAANGGGSVTGNGRRPVKAATASTSVPRGVSPERVRVAEAMARCGYWRDHHASVDAAARGREEEEEEE
eukprot:Rhum_TRINITY_DN12962_c4_g1::Rhum_TRINITY_DN12962_c4_g1_i1::g.55573::m.55573